VVAGTPQETDRLNTEIARPCPKTALVLSGGGMYGSYQAGVWAALHGAVRLDMVVGASIGCLNGWMIAGGCSGEELAQQWLGLGADSRVKWRYPDRVSEGIIDSSLPEGWIRRVYESCSPKMRYALVVTAMRTMQRVRFEYPAVTWQHLAASCAVPLFLRQQTIDGVLYGDGGLADPLPLIDAVEMGATRIITVNVLNRRPLLIRGLAAAARLYSGQRNGPAAGIEIIDISPEQPLGNTKDTIHWSRENAERWIGMGRRAADAKKHLVVECLERTL
jgi:predicted acylesterase/phospholipase RssA